jgi:hypothetical protein
VDVETTRSEVVAGAVALGEDLAEVVSFEKGTLSSLHSARLEMNLYECNDMTMLCDLVSGISRTHDKECKPYLARTIRVTELINEEYKVLPIIQIIE